jgi:Family of unknown function (DUF6502)
MNRIMDALFAPIARLLVARGVVFADAAGRLKRAYLQAAVRLAGPDATDSRISVMTGLQRRDIVALRGQEPDRRTVNHLSRLVALWALDGGRPLPRKGDTGSFDALALQVRRDVHPRTMLEQLMAAGTVSVADGMVRLEQASYQPMPGSQGQMDYLADNAGDFLAAAVGNVTGAPAHFERAVHYNLLDAAAVAQLDAAFREGQMALLGQINAQAAELQKTMPGNMRFRAGAYFYDEDEGI